jgi:hypothetical protein
LAYRLSSVTT